jgi:Tol biopolymer transport system component
VIDRDGGNLTRLADGDGPARWSPDGTWLVFPRYDWELPEGLYRSQVWIVPVDGGEPELIAKPAAAGW